MRNRKYLIGALLGVIAALAFSGIASAKPISMSLQQTISPKKQDKKKFGGVSLHNIITWGYDVFATSQSTRETSFTIDPNVKYGLNGNIPACQLSQLQSKPDAQARAACPRSITGQGTVELNGGALKGVVTLFSGGPNLIYLQVDVNNGSLVLTITGRINGRIVTFGGNPNTPGVLLTKFDTVNNKRKTGKSTYYVMARCSKKKKWSSTATTSFFSGETLSASSSMKCKQK